MSGGTPQWTNISSRERDGVGRRGSVEIAVVCWTTRLQGSLLKKFWCKKGNSSKG